LKRQKNSESLRRKIILTGIGFLLVIFLIASIFGKKGLIEVKQGINEERILLQEINRLKEEKLKLQREVEELEKNPQAVEKKAREKLWYIKPDEIVILKKDQ